MATCSGTRLACRDDPQRRLKAAHAKTDQFLAVARALNDQTIRNFLLRHPLSNLETWVQQIAELRRSSA
jgi:hypothetical protein